MFIDKVSQGMGTILKLICVRMKIDVKSNFIGVFRTIMISK